jgi:Homeodomain-like domain
MATTKSDAQRVGAKTAKAKAEFLAALRKHVTVTRACEAVGIHRSSVYRWRDEDPEFAAAFQDVDDRNVEEAEAVLYEMAVTGHPKRVYDKDGNLLEEYTVRDPKLLEFFLKARRPNVYRDRATVEHTGPGGGAVQVEAKHDLSKLSYDEICAWQALAEKARGDAGSSD